MNRDGAEWDEARTDGPHALSVRRTLPFLAPSTILAQSVLAHVVCRRLALAVLAVVGAVVALEPSVVVVMALRLLALAALAARGEVVDKAVVRVEEGALAECLEADDIYADAVGVVCGRGREIVQLVGVGRVGRVVIVGSGPRVVLLTRGEEGGVDGVVLLVAHLSDKILGRVQVQVAERSNLLLQEEEDWNQQSDPNQPPTLNSVRPLAHLSLLVFPFALLHLLSDSALDADRILFTRRTRGTRNRSKVWKDTPARTFAPARRPCDCALGPASSPGAEAGKALGRPGARLLLLRDAALPGSPAPCLPSRRPSRATTRPSPGSDQPSTRYALKHPFPLLVHFRPTPS